MTNNTHAWGAALSTLLDRIEQVADDPAAVQLLCQGRFAIAREHGLTVELLGLSSGTVQ